MKIMNQSKNIIILQLEFLNGKIVEDTLSSSNFTNPDHVLTIYTGGYPHHALRKLLYKLKGFIQQSSNSVEVYHWGDIDYGCILIFEHLNNYEIIHKVFVYLQNISLNLPLYLASTYKM